MKQPKLLIEKINNGENLTFNFVGDSITNGLNYCHSEETYCSKFAMLLSKHFENYTVYRYDGIYDSELSPIKYFDGPILLSMGTGHRKIDVIKNGIGGNTVLRAYNRIDNFTGTLANGEKADVTFLMFGINDALKSDPKKYVTADVFKENYKMLLHEIKARDPHTFIIMLSATTSDQTIHEHVQESIELAKEEMIPHINTHKLWKDHFDQNAKNFGHGDWLSDNGDPYHPTPKAAEIMAKYIFDAFIHIISN